MSSAPSLFFTKWTKQILCYPGHETVNIDTSVHHVVGMECGINRPLTSLTRFRKPRTFHSDYELGRWPQLLAVEMMRPKMLLIIQFGHEILKCHQLQPDTQAQSPGARDTDVSSAHFQEDRRSDLIKSDLTNTFRHYFDSPKMRMDIKGMARVRS